MSHRAFADRLNQELNEIGLPKSYSERVEAFAKMLKIPRFKAEIFLSGQSLPDEALMQLIAEELEVKAEWLLGKTEVKSD